jgi:hypothetical protein
LLSSVFAIVVGRRNPGQIRVIDGGVRVARGRIKIVPRFLFPTMNYVAFKDA